MLRKSRFALVIATLGYTLISSPEIGAEGISAAAAAPIPELENTELIVLLAAGQDAPTPDRVVELKSRGLELPAGLQVGEPTQARFVIRQRAQSEAKTRLATDPTSPEALLQRYLVLTYPKATDLEAVREALERNPEVLYVGNNRELRVSVEPADPLFPVVGQPHEHQWGSHSLDLPGAWDHSKGHAYVAVVDLGTDVTHPDIRAFDQTGAYVGGNFREHLSYDYGYDDAVVDEGQPQLEAGLSFCDPGVQLRDVDLAGHGTHVSGIVAATPNNGVGVAGACWHCSLIISKVSRLRPVACPPADPYWNTRALEADVVAGIHGSIDRGAQVLSLSLGYRPGADERPAPDCVAEPMNPICMALAVAQSRDVVISAATGNDSENVIDFPASDPRVLAAGGIEPDGQFWDDCPGFECGSNFDPDQFVTPAKQVISTFYRGIPYVPNVNDPAAGCDDSGLPGAPGFGPCTGTSMAAPYLAGVVGVLRSLNPLLSKDDVEDLLNSHLDNPFGWDPNLGRGKPDAAAAVEAALGIAGGTLVSNRLTPLFTLYSSGAETHLYTTFPQQATAAVFDAEVPYQTIGQGPAISGYSEFPGAPGVIPRASVYIFSSDVNLSTGTPPLVPLFRMSFDDAYGGNPQNRSFFYTTEVAGIELMTGVGYRLDGREGYIYRRCSPEPSCIPEGAVRLYRLYHSGLDDYALFPESELQSFLAAGYQTVAPLNDWIGYVYPNQDTDGDQVIDGFEELLGTCIAGADSDGDGLSDGQEILEYPYSDPGQCAGAPALETPWQENVNGTLATNIGWNYAMGYHFTPQVSGTVTQLGGFFNGTKTVKLFDKASGLLLAQATVTAADNWAYTPITPVNVQAGTTYTVAAYLAGSGASYRYSITPLPRVYGNIRIDGSTYASTSGNPSARPTLTVTSTMYGQADIAFSP